MEKLHRNSTVRRISVISVVGAALLLYPFVVKDPVLQNLAILAMLSGTAAIGWNLLGGFGGQISFGHAVFFGTGAYVTGALLIYYDVIPWLGLLAGMGIAVALGLVIGFPVFRLRGHYFTIATVALQLLMFIVVVNQPLLGEASGLPLPHKPESLLNIQFSVMDSTGYHLVALGILALSALAVRLYMNGRAGIFLRAIRDDEDVASANGVAVRRYKLQAMALSAGITAAAGSIFSMYALFVDPRSVLGIDRSIEIPLAAVLGGAGTFWGPVVGALILTSIDVWTRIRFGGLGNGVDFILFGTLIILISIYEPRGLAAIAQRWSGKIRGMAGHKRG